ncbi:MAG: RNA polymerase sigma factor [Vicinamibacterales bacterium]
MSSRTNAMAVPGTDAALGERAEGRALLDEREFHALYASTAGALRAYVARILGNAASADDIVQETYLRLLRTPIPTRDPGELRAYAFRIASNLVVDHYRARRHESQDVPPERGTPAPDEALRLDVGRLFARLKPRERQLVWLAHVEGADHREIAAATGLRTGSIRVLLSRARQRFARMLREHGHTTSEGR